MNLFNIYFKSLNQSGISYAITGRTEDYPEDIHSDIDIIIATDQMAKFWSFMGNVQNNGMKWIQVISHEITCHYYIVTLSDGDKHHLIKPDVCTDYYRKGTLFLKADNLLANRIFNVKGFYQLAPDREFIYYLLKKIDKGNISTEQFVHLKKQWEQDPTACQSTMKDFFSAPNQSLIINAIESDNINNLSAKFDLLKTDFHQSLKFSLKDLCLRLLNRASRIVKPTGLVVAFMGPDGCGKTTIINGVKTHLTEAFRQNKQFHLFPKEGKEGITVIDPHAEKPRGFMGSILKLLYFLFIYIKGYYLKIYPLKIKSTLVIFDRYFHDQIADPRRYRHGTSTVWIKLAGILIPKPDLWLLLAAPADVIQTRKSEVSPEETVRQLKSYKALFGTLKNAHVINANQSPEKVIYDAEQVIINYLGKRTAKRYKNK
jgi:thymidylate kinase